MRMGVAGAELGCWGMRLEAPPSAQLRLHKLSRGMCSVRKLLLLSCLFALTACEPITSPNQSSPTSAAKIRFVLDGESCRGAISLDFLIDQQVAGVKFLAAGDSAEFRTAPGSHTVFVRATGDGPETFGEWPTMNVEAPVRVILSCWI